MMVIKLVLNMILFNDNYIFIYSLCDGDLILFFISCLFINYYYKILI